MTEEVKDTSSSDVELEEDKDLDNSGTDAGDNQDDDSSKPENKKNAASRINELVAEVKSQREELERLRQEQAEAKAKGTPTPPTNTELTPDAQKAIAYLEKLGFTRKEDVEEKVKAIEDRIALDNEHSRLSSSYDGSDGRPRYDRAKVEQYMRDHAVYDPEIAYKALHETELLDWHTKKAKTGSDKKPYVEKPGGGGGRTDNNTITREKLQEVANNPTPENRAWYERNRTKIMSLMAEGQL